MKRTRTSLMTAALAVLLLSGCGSSGIGDILGGGGSTSSSGDLRGTVDYVNTQNRYIDLTNVSDYSSRLADGSSRGRTARVYYESGTPVEYQGNTYRPEDLERGDEVAVRLDQSGNQLIARSMTVLYDSSTGSGSGTGTGGYNTSIRGTVRYVDPGRRTIEVDRGYNGGVLVVDYDTNTPVTYNNRQYRPEDLERGDVVDLTVRDLGSGRMIAQRIDVVSSASGGGAVGGTTQSDVRGTVRYVDTARRTIELEQATWASGFISGGGSGSSTIVLEYDSNTMVEYQGQLSPPTNLERGDVVDARVRRVGARYIAERMYLVRNVRDY